MTRTTSHAYSLFLPLLLAVVSGCARTPSVSEDALYIAGDIEVYPDSIVIDGQQYTAISRYEITNDWQAARQHPSTTASLPMLHSSSRMADALYAKGISHYYDESPSTLDIFLSGALLAPERSMEILRSMAPGGTIHRHGFPIETDKEAWAAAAMEVYLATGSESWLKEAFRIITATYFKEMPTLKADNGLIHGFPSYMRHLKGHIPSWMEPIDEFQVIALGTNAWHYATLNTAAEMARLLKRKSEKEWRAKASETRNAINDCLWVPASSYYGQYMYGGLYPILSTSADNFANPLAVILGIATPEMASRLMMSRPMLPEGVPTVHPTPAGEKPTIDPHVQTMQGIAASRTGNEAALLGALSAVWRQSLGEHCLTEWPTLLLRGIIGISLTPDGMTFDPIIPHKLGQMLSLSGLHYRDAVLDITIRGAGDKIASFAIDSLRQHAAIIAPDLKGHHKIDIVMSGNRLSETRAAINPTQPATAPPMPRIYWSDERDGKIINFDPATSYDIYVNGILSETLNTANYTVSDTGTSVIDIIPVTNGVSGFSPRSHISATSQARIHIPATAITPRRPPIHLIRNRDTASHYIELAARHNTRLTFYVQAPADGEYFIDIAYSNGTTETAMRTLEVNDSHAGTFICPAVNHNDWLTTRRSSTLRTNLRKGVNKLSLTYVNATILLHDIYLLRK